MRIKSQKSLKGSLTSLNESVKKSKNKVLRVKTSVLDLRPNQKDTFQHRYKVSINELSN